MQGAATGGPPLANAIPTSYASPWSIDPQSIRLVLAVAFPMQVASPCVLVRQ
jgi:hypothetical protein